MGFKDWFKRPVSRETDDSLIQQVAEFVAKLETEESATWCKCLWRVHPDDQHVKGNCCRECDRPISDIAHKDIGADDYHLPRGIRKIRADEHHLCPVHTKEGLLYAFVEWRNGR